MLTLAMLVVGVGGTTSVMAETIITKTPVLLTGGKFAECFVPGTYVIQMQGWQNFIAYEDAEGVAFDENSFMQFDMAEACNNGDVRVTFTFSDDSTVEAWWCLGIGESADDANLAYWHNFDNSKYWLKKGLGDNFETKKSLKITKVVVSNFNKQVDGASVLVTYKIKGGTICDHPMTIKNNWTTAFGAYGGVFTATAAQSNIFKMENFEVGDYQKVVIKFGEAVPSDWAYNYQSGVLPPSIPVGATELEIPLDGNNLPELTIFNWNENPDPINISEVYLYKEELEGDEALYDKTIPEGFENLILNGDLEGSGLDNFRVNDYFESSKRVVAEPRIVADPTNENNHVITITSNDNAENDHDAQLFVTLPEDQHFNVGDTIRLRMRVKAVASGSAGSQFHNAPGEYIYWDGPGKINFKTVWRNFDTGDVEIDAAKYNDNGKGPSRTVAFNLSVVGGESNTFYFDEIQLLVKRGDPLKQYKEELQAAITLGKAQSAFAKTEESFAALAPAITAGENALNATNATQESLTNAKNAIYGAINGFKLQDGYVNLTKSMFHEWTGIGDDATIKGAGGCDFNLNTTLENNGMLYGNTSVMWDQYAKIVNAKSFIVLGKSGSSFGARTDRLEVGNGGGDDHGGSLTTVDINIGEDGKCVIDLSEKASMRINAIKGAGFVTDMLIEYKPVVVTVGTAGYSTFSSDLNVKANSAKAYAAKLNGSKVTLTEVTEIPANSGVIVEANAGTYEFPVVNEAAAIANNDLKVSDGTVAGDGTIYVLAKKNDVVGFYKLTGGDKVPAGKAYLKVANAGSREYIAIDGGATSIKSVETENANGAIYNLAGQQVKNAQKGIFIMNGKKVIK